MSTLTDAKLRKLPQPIVDKLQSLINRARRLMLIRGLFATLAVALVCILVIMGIDATLTLFSDTIRWALSLTGLAITGLAAWYFLVRPLSRRLTLTRIARVIETRHPELQERISTAVELMNSDDPDSIRGSAELIDEVVNSAVIDVADVNPEKEFAPARSRRPMFVVAGIAVFLLLLAAIFPRHVGVLFARAVAPFLDIGNAYANTLTVKPGDLRVAIGDPVEIEISIQNDKIRRAELRRSTTSTAPGPDRNARPKRSDETVERMTLASELEDGTQTYRINFPSVEESFDYRIRAGAAVSEYFTITAVPLPEVEELKIGYDFPDYTQLKSTESVSDNGEIRAVARTRVSVTAKLNKPVKIAKLLVADSDESIAEATIDGDQARWEFELSPGMQSDWKIAVEDIDGFTNTPIGYQMTAIADATPKVEIVAPGVKLLKLKPDEFLPLYYTVAEDFGFREVHLYVKPDRTDRDWRLVQASPEPASVTRDESRFGGLWDNVQQFFGNTGIDGTDGQWRGDAPLDLSSLDLEGIGKLTVRVVVEDNLPADFDGPNVGYSEALVIELDANAQSLVRQTVDNQLKEIQEAIRESRTEVEKARQQAREAERQLAKEDQVNPEARKDLEALREHAANAAEKLRETAEQMKQTAFNQQAEQLKDVADEEIAKAQQAADAIPLSDQKDERVAEAKNATLQLEQASKELQEIEKSLKDARADAQLIAELNELANEQRQLAQNAQQQAQNQAQQQPQADPAQAQQQQQQQQQELSEWQRQQQQVQRELAQVLRENEAALREVLQQRQEQASSLSEQARELAEQQQALRDMTELAAKAGQQQSLREQLVASLQQEQKSIAAATRQLQQQQSEVQPTQPQASTPDEATQPTQNADAAAAPNSAQASPPDSEKSADAAPPASDKMAATDTAQESPPAGPTAENQATADAKSSTDAAASQSGDQNENSPDAKPAPGNATQALAEASRQTEQAAEQLDKQDLASAAESAQQAQQQLARAQQQAKAAAQPSTAPMTTEDTPDASRQEAASQTDNAEKNQPAPGAEQAASDSPAMAESAAQTPLPSEAGDAAQAPPASPPSAASEASAAQAQAEQLGQLSERQQQVAQQLEAIAAGQVDQALAEREAQLAAQAGQLAEQSQALQNATEMAQASARSTAKQATDRLTSGQRSANQASQQLDQAQQAQNQATENGQAADQPAPQAQKPLSQSQASQQDARNKFEQAAASLEQTAKSLGQQSDQLSGEKMDSPFLDSQNLSQSFQDVSDAATSPSADQAAQNAQQAAQSLQQMAQAAMQQLGSMGNQPPQPNGQQGQPGDPNQQNQPPSDMTDAANPQLGDGERNADLDGNGIPPELQALGLSIEDWAQMKGSLQSGRDTTNEGSTPTEYRDLVTRYFRAIANQAAQKN